ncbi:MAG: ferrous iron transport protein A [Campylobacterales bacterium]|nr:ferrous iron transport protein A [Campylobacterales bacterium]
MKLNEAPINKIFEISKIEANEPIKSRLLAMGFAKGNRVSILDFTLSRQTYDVLIEDTKVAIRKEEALCIELKDMS